MKSLMIRVLSMLAVIGIVFGYNMVLDVRAKEDQIAMLNAELESARLEQEYMASAERRGADTVLGSDESETDGKYIDGTYTGEAQGFGGSIQVEVIVENSRIMAVEITSADGEDGPYLAMAQDIIPDILDVQSADVDTVSGATFSSTGIKDAVAEALEKAAG